MTFKEFKKQRKLNPTSGFCLSYDWYILCDIAERAGFNPIDNYMIDHYGDHQTYLEENGFDLWHENIFINDPDLIKLEQFTNEDFSREYFFDNYTVEDSYTDNDFGFVVRLVQK